MMERTTGLDGPCPTTGWALSSPFILNFIIDDLYIHPIFNRVFRRVSAGIIKPLSFKSNLITTPFFSDGHLLTAIHIFYRADIFFDVDHLDLLQIHQN